jgi:hypothetical protein
MVKGAKGFRSKVRNNIRQTKTERRCGRGAKVFNRRQKELDKEKWVAGARLVSLGSATHGSESSHVFSRL